MVSASNGAKPNPNLKNPKNVYHIGGIQVAFPYRPYGSQLAFMGRVISTLDRAQREGHCHALLESPTGTGKSLSLLCSILAWLQNYKIKNQNANLSQSKPAPEAFTDPLEHGGGFIPEVQSSMSENMEPPQPATNNKNQKKKTVPTIYYASRTHSQISQVIREYRKTAYRVPMAVLASRKHYCTNKNVRGKENLDEECKLLLKNQDQDAGCLEFKNVHKVKGHPSLQKGGCHEAHDIEDIVKVGQVVKGCSYYAARSMATDAQLVFCPYNYIVNPVIRGAMEVDIKGAIVILDEAHNIEDIARDAGSVDVEEDALHKVQSELEQLCAVDALVYQPLYEMIQDILSWINQRKTTLDKRDFQHYVSCWTGDKALRELEEANISKQCFPILLECATKAFKAATDPESEIVHLSGMSVIILEGLFSSLTYFFSRNGCHTFDYQLALQRYVKRDPGKPYGGWTHTLSLWCLNPAVVFRDITDLSLSVILTSGTLSPMNSFSSELGVQFGTSLEAPHVIDVESQVWPAIISTGPGNYPLNASYKTADGYPFQDAVGKSLEEIFLIVPGGCLVFFPSYKLMEKLCSRWSETGQWSRLDAKKSLFVEPRGGSQDDFDSILKGYYDSIRQGNKPLACRKRRVKKMDANHCNESNDHKNTKKGAAFFAVCRGKLRMRKKLRQVDCWFNYCPVGSAIIWKVSEGIDFSDDNARAVIIVGIPFPNINDIQVGLKKKYNDTYKSSKNVLSGSDWYCQQTFRALNQAAGRCIRHRFDFGAIILLDERFREERNRTYISKWIRKSIKEFGSFDESLAGLRSFFSDVKERLGKCSETVSQKNVNEQIISSTDQSKGSREKKDENLDKFSHFGQKFISKLRHDDSFTLLKSQGDTTVQVSVHANQDANDSISTIDLECSSEKDSRCHESLSMKRFDEDPDISFIKETPSVRTKTTAASLGSTSRDENSSSTIVEATTEFPDQLSVYSMSVISQIKAPLKTQCSIASTPEKDITANSHSLMPEKESYLNMSVNSHTHKRRKSMCTELDNLAQDEFDASKARTPECDNFTRSSSTSIDANHRVEFGFETSCTEKFRRSCVGQLHTEIEKTDCVSGCMSYSPAMDKRLQISCSLCRSPLGLPENHLYVTCLITMSSKVHLASLFKERLGTRTENLTSIPIVLTDISSIDHRLLNKTPEREQGIWCEGDGCVFSPVFCPFCRIPNNCLGVQIMATDALNVQLLNKIMFYSEILHIKQHETSRDKALLAKDLSPVSSSGISKIAVLDHIAEFAYSPQQNNSGDWRTTKSKLRIPKRPAS